MPLTATKAQTASLLGVSDDTVDNLLHQGRLRRTLGNRFVHITLESLAEYTHLPLEVVVNEFRLVPLRPQNTAISMSQQAVSPKGNETIYSVRSA